MIKILGIGDNVVDKNYTTHIMYPGGNSFNFAVFGQRLGHKGAYAGVIGSDREARMVTDTLKAEGVDISHCQYKEGETGICGIHLYDGDRVIEDENDQGLVKSDPYTITDEVFEYAKGFDVIHSSCFSHIEEQLLRLKEAGLPVLYDFSDVWEDEDIDKVCPNITIAFFSGKDLPFDELELKLRHCVDDLGCEMAITTAGTRGAMVYNGRKIYFKEPYNAREEIVDTTGAGDSWITAFTVTYFEHIRIWNELHKGDPEHFTTECDREDYEDKLIDLAMCAGNLFARRNCLEKGSVGYGTEF